MKSTNVVVLEAKSDSTYKLNNAKKSHQPNWESRNDAINSSKIRSKYLARLDVVNPKDQFESVNCKWRKIVDSMNANRHSLLPKINVVYKNKWGTITETSSALLITWHHKKKHEILRFDPIIKYKLECASPLQQNDV